MTDRAVPNLPSRDFDATIAFYRGFGFEQDYRDEGWLILRRGELSLEFFPFADLDPASSSFMCSIRVDDVDELYRRITAAGVVEKTVGFPRVHPVTTQPSGLRIGNLIDIDGTQLNLIENPAP
ncbi:lactoylglutathione lyase [Microbacterium testaceum StLB037]|uniref:Bleomycin resistance protein n=1 Tax=Microbacterium testaceum (strain StLB037) TaxID=979556 RepID=E8N9R4_MICTS|nr:bleomycin resistance protein [Microbacterium testaceum]BAJ74533.1 lactoylglutathione lyase [Microbacterium testaceum StLB037]